MNSIKSRFNRIANENPQWAPYTCLAIAITNRKYNHKTIRRNFLELVPGDNYDFDDEKELIAELGKL